MAELAIHFEWKVDKAGYVPFGEHRTKPKSRLPRKPPPDLLLMPLSGKFKVVRPLDEPQLFRAFAELDGSSEGCAEFASQYGPLTEKGNDDTAGDPLSVWRQQISWMRSAVQLGEQNLLELRKRLEGVPIAELVAMIRPDALGGRPQLVHVPVDLLNALRLQLLHMVASDQPVRVCRWCHVWFATGPKAGRRRGAVFCSVQCKTDYHNHLKLIGSST
jgi:hypothetical protein